MIGIVVVAHSQPLAEAAVTLARQFAPADAMPTLAVAAGDARVGFDAAAVTRAIQQADSPDGVLVLLDVGTTVLAAQLAVSFLEADQAARVALSSAPLVEGLLAAVVAASSGADLESVAQQARASLTVKAEQLGDADAEAAAGEATQPIPVRAPERKQRAETLTWRTQVVNPHGLHIRPAAAIVTALRDLDADVQLGNASTGRGLVSATSIARITGLEVQPGQILEARISGPQAHEARTVLADLAATSFGDRDGQRPRLHREPLAPVDIDDDGAAGSGNQTVVGPVHRRTAVPGIDGYHPQSPKVELGRFTEAVEQVEDYLSALAAARPASSGILSAQAVLAADRELAHDVVGRITEGFSAVDAVLENLTRMARNLDGLTDPYLRERAQDVRSVRRLLLLALMGRDLADDEPGEPCVWLVDELDAATAARLDSRLCLGVITTKGGRSGHGSLTAAARGIPVLTGREDAAHLAEGKLVAMDPVTNELWIDPAPELQAELHRRNIRRETSTAHALARSHNPAFTLDGRRILVEANVSSLADARIGARAGAEGSGVVRTEIIFAARSVAPTAEEQAEVYTQIGRTLGGGQISIRTWDAGGDKPLAFLPSPLEPNPVLGSRGLRAMPRSRRIFAEQLRGIALAARQTPVRVMFPMVTDPREVVWAREVLDEVLREVGPVDLPVGIMIEVPAAALGAGAYAGLVDYVSVGTNDLAQYVLAADRTNAAVAELAPADHPALLQLIGMVCDQLPDVPVAVCGNVASEPHAAGRLVELGVTELSVRPPLVPEVKQAVRCVGRRL